MRLISPLIALAGLALLGSTWGGSASARTLRVDPILVEIDSSRRTASVSVTNAEDVPVTIRAHALAWNQEGGDNQHERAGDLIVSPPIFTLPPRSTQTIRIGERRTSIAGKAYRLIVEEVPEASPGGGIQVALRLDLPLFVNIAPAEPSILVWTAGRRPDGVWAIEARNPGNGYVRLDHAVASAATGLAYGDDIFFGTILPGSARRWLLGREPRIVNRDRLQQILQADQVAPSRTALDRR